MRSFSNGNISLIDPSRIWFLRPSSMNVLIKSSSICLRTSVDTAFIRLSCTLAGQKGLQCSIPKPPLRRYSLEYQSHSSLPLNARIGHISKSCKWVASSKREAKEIDPVKTHAQRMSKVDCTNRSIQPCPWIFQKHIFWGEGGCSPSIFESSPV